MTNQPTEPFPLTPIFDQLLREQEQSCPDDSPDDTEPDRCAEPEGSPSPS